MGPGGVAVFAGMRGVTRNPASLFHVPCAEAWRTTPDKFLAKGQGSRQPRGGSAHGVAHGDAVIIQTWAELLAALDQVLDFARGLDLDEAVRGSRFTDFRARLADLAELLEREGSAATFARFTEDIDRHAVALTESQELAMSLSYLRSISRDQAERKIQIVLQGPELPVDEDPNSNHARNTMFELNLGARLQRAGIDVEPGRDADLEFACSGVRWFGECKRPYKVETFENNLAQACRQIGVRLSSSRLAARGLVAVSLSRPLAARVPYIEYSSADVLRQGLKEHVSSLVQLMEERMQVLSHCQAVSGMGFLVGHLIMPAWDVRARLPTTVQHTVCRDICRDRSGDGARLWTRLAPTFNEP